LFSAAFIGSGLPVRLCCDKPWRLGKITLSENAKHFPCFKISPVTGWRLQLSTHEMIQFVGTFSMLKALS
jgi:hypothetical protein